MRVGTFNLLHGLAVLDAADDEPGPAGVTALAEGVASLQADVLGLQEVDVAQPRSGGAHQVRAIAEAMDAEHWRFAPSLRGTPGERGWSAPQDDDAARAAAGGTSAPLYGVGLVSRLPVLQWRTTTFPGARLWLPLLVAGRPRPRFALVRDEPRAAIAAVIEGAAGPVTVATAHLSFVPGWNIRQLRALRRWLADLPRPLLLVGDLNLPGDLPARITGWASLAHAPTFPVSAPRIQLDHVLADGLSAGLRMSARAQVHRLQISDHAALTVDFELPHRTPSEPGTRAPHLSPGPEHPAGAQASRRSSQARSGRSSGRTTEPSRT